MDEVKQDKPQGRGGRTALIAAAIAAGALVLCYAALCIYTGLSGTILPHISMGGVDLGGMTRTQAVEALSRAVDGRDGQLTVELSCGTWSGELPQGSVQADVAAGAEDAWQVGRENPVTMGARLIGQLLGNSVQLDLPAVLTEEGEQALEEEMDQADRELPGRAVQPTWRVEEDKLIFTTGVPGRTLDREQTRQDAEDAATRGLNDSLAGGEDRVELPLAVEETPAQSLNFQEIYDEIYTEPQDAVFDPEAREVIPHVTGASFDVDAAQARADAAAEGQELSIPLTLTEPEVTTQQLEELMFSDVLGECTTNVGGTTARLGNVTLAAEKCNDYILMPGEVFSYNTVVGPRTTAAGFLPAPAYVQGQTVNEVGGGICQVSSTLYLACLRSNLEIVERRNHSYISDYITAGMDATVAYNSIDYQFRNDTEYPILIQAEVDGRKLTVRILGTKTDDITVKMTYSILSTTPYEVIYEPDESVPVGTTRVKVSPYNGYKVVVYRNLYDGDGNLISSTEESVSTYRKRDRVVLYNPADAASLGITTGGTETVPPEESGSPGETTPPAETGNPMETTPPAETGNPGETTPPAETGGPGESGSPGEATPPEETGSPEETPSPDESAPPAETGAPSESIPPAETGSPAVSAQPSPSPTASGGAA